VTVTETRHDSEVRERIGRIDELIQDIESAHDPALRATAQELVQAIMDLHGSALERMVSLLRGSGAAGQSILEQFGRDELVRNLLLLYDQHPQELEARVLEALEKTRPYLHSHGGNVELVSVDDGTRVRLKLLGSCHGCPSSSLTLKMAVEQAIREAAPEITAIVVDGEQAVESTPLVALALGPSRVPAAAPAV
jgi:Fe-S cluster biogenesis protein NfuA